MITSTITKETRTCTYTVELALSGVATIELDFRETAHVTDLHISYTDGAVTRCAYIYNGDVCATIHPDYLDLPQAWPDWVRFLVEEHRPVA